MNVLIKEGWGLSFEKGRPLHDVGLCRAPNNDCEPAAVTYEKKLVGTMRNAEVNKISVLKSNVRKFQSISGISFLKYWQEDIKIDPPPSSMYCSTRFP